MAKKYQRKHHESSMLSLTPKQALLSKIQQLSHAWFDLSKRDLDVLKSDELLASHTVPVCIPHMKSLQELDEFISANAEVLFDMMLSSWTFPNHLWGFLHKNRALLNEYVNIKYFPRVFKAIDKPVNKTLELAVIFVVPTEALKDYFAELVSSNSIHLNEKELSVLDFLLATGVAIVTNKINREDYKTIKGYIRAMDDPVHYTSNFKEKFPELLCELFFLKPSNLSEQPLDEALIQWFRITAYTGLYLLFPQGEEQRKAS